MNLISLLLATFIIFVPDATLTVFVVYNDPLSGEERYAPDGTPVNLYQDGHLVDRKDTKHNRADFLVNSGKYLIDAVLGRADKTRFWVCRDTAIVENSQKYIVVHCRKEFLLFYPFILPGR